MRLIISALVLGFALQAQATITLNVQFGAALDSTGVSVADGTLWALVADTDDNNTFTGFGLNSNLSSSAQANTYFDVNQSLSIGQSIAGDVVIAMGAFNGFSEAGILGVLANTVADLVYDSSTLGDVTGIVAGRDFAFYWFPAATYTGAGSYSIASYTQPSIGDEVGGVNTAAADAGGGTGAMVLPGDGASSAILGAWSVDLGGDVPSSSFNAVMIPEPSALALIGLGGLLLLRRKRTS